MTNYALIIGINYTSTYNRLYGCINDCILVKSNLMRYYDVSESNIVFLRDDIYGQSDSLYPSKKNIMSSLKELISKGSANSKLFFHYSGHGSRIRDTNGDETDGYDEFIVPIDYFNNSYFKITDDELYQEVLKLNKSAKLFMIFDCCNSGTMMDLPYKYEFNQNVLYEKRENRDTTLESYGSIICISGCRDDEYSLDVSINGKANGAMTTAVDMSLRTANYEPVSIKSSIISIYKFLKDNRYDIQRPLITSNKKLDLNESFMYFKRPANASGASLLTSNETITSTSAPATTTTEPEQTTTTEPEQTTTTEPEQTTTTEPEQTTTTEPSYNPVNIPPSPATQTNTQPLEVSSSSNNKAMVQGLLTYLISTDFISRQDLEDITNEIFGTSKVNSMNDFQKIMGLFSISKKN